MFCPHLFAVVPVPYDLSAKTQCKSEASILLFSGSFYLPPILMVVALLTVLDRGEPKKFPKFLMAPGKMVLYLTEPAGAQRFLN
jgi:hypothetical protein